MAAESRRDTDSLKESLFRRGRRFEFFQAVRLLKTILADRASIGRDFDPGEEVVRFRSDVSLAFPRTDIRDIRPPPQSGEPPELTVAFMGVATPSSFGSLPKPYAELIRELAKEKNFALRDFLDLFNHRLISLFFRAWEKYNLPIRFEFGGDNVFEDAIFGAIGMQTEGLRGRLSFDDRALLARAGLLAMAPVPATVLESLVESYYGVPVRVVQFLPSWYAISETDQNRVGQVNSRLGEDLVIGSTVQLSQYRFRVCLGPLGWEQYEELLPNAAGFPALVELVRLAASEEFDFEVQLILRKEDVPALHLSAKPERRCRLGWSTWLKSEAFAEDAGDALLRSELDLTSFQPAGAEPKASFQMEAHS